MFTKIKEFLFRIVAKKVIDETTGQETFEKSKTKIGVIIYAVSVIIDTVLPEFGIVLPISDKLISVAELLGISMAGYGLRDAQEKAAIAVAKKK